MSSVRISVDSRLLGDVEVSVDSHVGYYDPEGERAAIDGLITDAVAKIRRAYGIGEPA